MKHFRLIEYETKRTVVFSSMHDVENIETIRYCRHYNKANHDASAKSWTPFRVLAVFR